MYVHIYRTLTGIRDTWDDIENKGNSIKINYKSKPEKENKRIRKERKEHK